MRLTTTLDTTGGLQIGLAKATAANQRFLDTCPAVKAWCCIETDGDGEPTLWAFTFDHTVEVPLVPRGVRFGAEEDGDDERIEALVREAHNEEDDEEEALEDLREFVRCARGIGNAWCGGDLAGAVNRLTEFAEAVNDAYKFKIDDDERGRGRRR